MKSIRLLAPLAACALGSSPAFAHTMWLNMVPLFLESSLVFNVAP